MALKPYKKDFGYSYAYGASATLEMLTRRPQDAISVHLHTKGAKNKGVDEIRAVAQRHSIEIIEANAGIDRLTNTENTYAIGVFRKYTQELDSAANHIVLAGIQDKGNLGTILRTMLGFGFENLAIIKPAVDIFDPKVVRASMGAIFNVRFAYFSTFAEYQQKHPRNYYPFITNASESLENIAFEAPYSLIFGSESEGLNSTYSSIGQAVHIQQSDKIDSLNLSIAVGVALHVASLQK